MERIQPAFLKPGSKIALIAPSFGCTDEPYKTKLMESIKNLKAAGYRVDEGENIWVLKGVAASNTPQKRAEEFMKAYADESVDAIFSVGGGELMCEILPFIDFKKIQGYKPKWFMGFSDNTNLTFTLTAWANLVTVYGPCAGQFFSKPFRLDAKDAMRMLQGEKEFEGYPLWERNSLATPENPLAPLNLTEKKVLKPYNYQRPFSGIMLGGCLDCLINICGTKYDNVSAYVSSLGEGVVWYLEACDLNPLSIRRALFELREAGWFKTAKGFVIGRPVCFGMDLMGVNQYNAVTDILGECDVPIIMDADLGHLAPAIPYKNGALATVGIEDNNLKVVYKE